MLALPALGLGIFLLAQSGACTRSAVVGPDGGRVPIGAWGGQGVALQVTETGAHIEFDCASGEIAQPLMIDNDGRLAVDGVFVQERAGAIRVGEEPERKPARYSGRVDSKTMTLNVVLTESNETMGTFTLTRGADPRVRKCR